MVRFSAVFIIIAGFVLSLSHEAQAFEYIEHSYLSDRACWQAQLELRALLKDRPDDTSLRARYLALAIACPDRSPSQYCIDERKAVASHLHRIGDQPWETRAHPLTFGDFSALVDHLSRFGPIRGLEGAKKPGFTQDMLGWFSTGDTAIRGVIGGVGRRTCSYAEQVPWDEVEADVSASTSQIFDQGMPNPIPTPLLSPLARTAPIEGPADPSARYSITNPHYLDLVLRNHNHFGEEAFDTWLGYHSASLSIAARRCRTTYAINRRKSEQLARGLPAFEALDWKELSESERAAKGCAVLAEHTRQRLIDWADRADERLSAPVSDVIDGLRTLPETADPSLYSELDMVVAALKSLIFLGGGLHYLQDGYAGGHIRTIRTRGGLEDARYDHDYDNAAGVSAIVRTRAGDFPYVAFGDRFMLGPHHEIPDHCDWERFLNQPGTPEQIGACLLRHQRGLLVATSTAGIIDWAVGGLLFEPIDPARCERSDLERSTCNLLPLTPVSAPGAIGPRSSSDKRGLHPGNLPVPPPPFAYESLITTLAFDVAGSNSQFGLQLTLLSELDRFAHWMTSYRTAILASSGSGELSQILGEFSYNFHFRFAARVLFEAGAGGFSGFRGIGEGLTFMAGLRPSAGLVVLPEGWVKIPLELSLSFRLPMTFFTSSDGFFGDSFGIEAYWLQFGLGLAFM